MVREIVAGVGRPPLEAVVFVAPLASDAKAPGSDALLATIGEQVAGRLGGRARFVATPLTLAAARAEARDARGFLYLRVAIAGGRLRLVADAYPVARSVWARARAAHRGPVAHAQAQAPIDAEVRSYLEPLSFEAQPKVAQYDGADAEILALACGDLDGDGGSELFTMTRHRVVQVRLAEAQVERVAEAKWSEHAPVAPVPLREPLGFATVVEGPSGYLDVSVTDREGSLRLGAGLAVLHKPGGLAVPHGATTACARIENLLLGPARKPCSPSEQAPPFDDVGHPTDALAATHWVSPGGEGTPTVALRKQGMLVVRRGAEELVIAPSGAQLAVGDLDQDGALEVVSALDTLAPKHDAVEVRTLTATGTVKKRARLPAPLGVRALAICPPDGPGVAPLVVATGTQLWVVR